MVTDDTLGGMKLASFNLCRGGGRAAGETWRRLITEVGADIVCAQETRYPGFDLHGADGDSPSIVHELVPKGRWGSAVVARRHPLTPLPVLEGYVGWVVGACVHGVEIGGQRQDLHVYSVHIPSPGPYERRVGQFIDVLGRLCADVPRIAAGDFNVTVALRQLSESRANTKGERRLLARLDEELGLVNAWQAMNPDTPLPQTLRWSRDKSVPYHCDGIFIDRRCLPHLTGAGVLDYPQWVESSDHNPVVAEWQ